MTLNANDSLRGYTCADNYYKHFLGMVITDGVKALADNYECYWFIDVVASYQPELRQKQEDFQTWKLTKYDDGSAIVECTDGNKKKLKRQEIPFTDFKAKEATVWVEGNVILLPSEH